MVSREALKRRTRARIVRAADELLADRGFDATSVDDIARRAGICTRTFFRYFPAKEDVAFPHHDRRLAAFRRDLQRNRDAADPLGGIRAGLVAFAARYEAEANVLAAERQRVLASAQLGARDIREDHRFETALVEEAEAGGLSRESARILAGAIMGAIRATLEMWLERGGGAGLAEIAGPLLELLEGIGPLVHRGREAPLGAPGGISGEGKEAG